MLISQFISRRMAAGAIALGIYGLWVCLRLPAGMDWGVRWAAWAWALALFAGAGMALSGLIGSLAVGVGRWFGPKRFPAVAATIETFLLAPFFIWLLFNEVTYRVTSEVISYQTMLMIWANPGATLQNSWQMGGRYLVAVAVIVLGATVVAWWLSRRSFRAGWSPIEQVQRSARRRLGGPRAAGSLIGSVAAIAGLFAWQFQVKPSEALTIVCRSAPPLRALNLTRALIGDELKVRELPEWAAGVPIKSDAEYQAAQGIPPPPAPNVVMIVLESVPARALHCYGHPRADMTPNMDKLAAEGVLFEHCWATGSFSSYGLVSIMTSLYMLRAPSNDHFADTSFPFMGLPRALKLAGYELALFSSGNEAFDNINHFTPPKDFDSYFSLDVADVPKPDCMRLEDHYAIERFESWMAGRRDPRPFYCGFYLQSTHFNYEVPEPWGSYYQPVPTLYSNGSGILQIPPDVLPLLKNQYDNAMRYSDYWVGRIREALEKSGTFDNTIVVIAGDHGEAFMEHGLARHGVALWEEMIHIPLIMHVGPAARERLGQKLPSRVGGTVSGADVAPTIAGLVGIRPHPSWQGENVLAAGYTGKDRPVFSVLQLTKWQEAVVLNGFKYIYDLDEVAAQLFDLNRDPGESVDLIRTRPEMASALKSVLAAWHTRQLNYYARPPYTWYLGPFRPAPATFRASMEEAGHELADRQR